MLHKRDKEGPEGWEPRLTGQGTPSVVEHGPYRMPRKATAPGEERALEESEEIHGQYLTGSWPADAVTGCRHVKTHEPRKFAAFGLVGWNSWEVLCHLAQPLLIAGDVPGGRRTTGTHWSQGAFGTHL